MSQLYKDIKEQARLAAVDSDNKFATNIHQAFKNGYATAWMEALHMVEGYETDKRFKQDREEDV